MSFYPENRRRLCPKASPRHVGYMAWNEIFDLRGHLRGHDGPCDETWRWLGASPAHSHTRRGSSEHKGGTTWAPGIGHAVAVPHGPDTGLPARLCCTWLCCTAGAQECEDGHAFIFCLSRSLFGHVSIVIPPLFFYLSRIGNSFPKRVLIRKKAISDPRNTDPALTCWLAERPGQTRVFVTLVTDVIRPAKNASAVDIPS
eukprot:SAG25_NODE_128_length_14556_cov_11.699405_3_plen_200_part_00